MALSDPSIGDLADEAATILYGGSFRILVIRLASACLRTPIGAARTRRIRSVYLLVRDFRSTPSATAGDDPNHRHSESGAKFSGSQGAYAFDINASPGGALSGTLRPSNAAARTASTTIEITQGCTLTNWREVP